MANNPLSSQKALPKDNFVALDEKTNKDSDEN